MNIKQNKDFKYINILNKLKGDTNRHRYINITKYIDI